MSSPLDNAQKTITVYAIVDGDGHVRYVGQSKNAEARVRNHWWSRRSPARVTRNPGLCAWLQTLPVAPAYIVLDKVAYSDRYTAESRWTEHYRATGEADLNVYTGNTPSAESARKVGEALRGRPRSEETRAKISVGKLGRPNPKPPGWSMSEAERARVGAMNRGKPMSPETRERLRRANEKTTWCDECKRAWHPATWARHIRKYHEGGTW